MFIIKKNNNRRFNTKKKINENMTKIGVYIIGFLFISSIFAVAMIEGSGTQKKVEIPQNPILSTYLDRNQINLLNSVYGTYVEIETNLCDFECMQNINTIESFTATYSPYFYMYKNTNSKETKIFLENYQGVNNLTKINPQEIENHICEIIPGHPECIKRTALDAVFTPTNNSN